MIKKVVFYLLFLSVFFSIYGEDFFIERIDISIEGMTNEKSLLRVTELYEGQIFPSETAMDHALKIAKDKLDDIRLFKTVEIRKSAKPAVEQGVPVVVTINIVDSWNIIALPYPKYDSNDGFEFSLRARDYNFLGLMVPLRVNLNYVNDENHNNNFAMELSYSYYFPIGGHVFQLGFGQAFNYSPYEEYGDDFYMGSSLTFGTEMVLPWEVYDGNMPRYSVETSLEKEYSPQGISEDKDELAIGFSHGLSLGHLSWDGDNFREGVAMSLNNDWTYDIDDDRTPEQAWDGSLSGQVQFHKDLYPLGYSGRMGAVRDLKDRTNVEGEFRGILEREDREARSYVYFNNALYLTVWNSRNFWEIMGGPCLDIGYLWDVPEDQDRIAWSIAVEGLCYPAFAKSFEARITIGMSGNGFAESSGPALTRVRKNLELFFGLNKFY